MYNRYKDSIIVIILSFSLCYIIINKSSRKHVSKIFLLVIGPGKQCKFEIGYGNGKHVRIGKHSTRKNCVYAVKHQHPTANAATFRRNDLECFAVFNATSMNAIGNEYETCIFLSLIHI